MATDLTIYLDDQPGELARLGHILGRSGVNIEGFCAVTSGGGQGEIHVLVEDEAAAFEALDAVGIEVASEQEVVVVAVQDRPGVLGEVSDKLGEAEVNITLAYLATSTRMVLAADNLAEAKAALDGL
jgi:hypothetical protein